MDESTFYACWKVIDTLELEAYKELENLWKRQDANAPDAIHDHTNMLQGIIRARKMLELKCYLVFDKSIKELDHD